NHSALATNRATALVARAENLGEPTNRKQLTRRTRSRRAYLRTGAPPGFPPCAPLGGPPGLPPATPPGCDALAGAVSGSDSAYDVSNPCSLSFVRNDPLSTDRMYASFGSMIFFSTRSYSVSFIVIMPIRFDVCMMLGI